MMHKWKNKHYFIKYLILVIPLVLLSVHIANFTVFNNAEGLYIQRLINFSKKFTMGEGDITSERHHMFLVANVFFGFIFYFIITMSLKLSYLYVNFDGFYEKRKREGIYRNFFTMAMTAALTLIIGAFKIVAAGFYFGAGGFIALLVFAFMWGLAVPILKYYMIFIMPMLSFYAYLTKKIPSERVPNIWKMLLFDVLILIVIVIVFFINLLFFLRGIAILIYPLIPAVISEDVGNMFIATLMVFIPLSTLYWMLVLKNEYIYGERKLRLAEKK